MNQKELETKIKEAQVTYYNGSPIMSDVEFDALWDELKTNYPDSELLKEVGSDHTDGFVKAKHRIIMGSQNKANTVEEMDTWFQKQKTKTFVKTLKLDGASIALEYEDGKFANGITRGDGEFGDLITRNVLMMQGLVKELKEDFTGVVRGEVLLYRSDKEKYFPDKKNCRNAAAGIMKHLDGADCDKLHIKVYEARPEDNRFKTQAEALDFLSRNGFDVVNYTVETDMNGQKAIDLMDKTWKAERDYDIDGLVWKTFEIDYDDLEKNYRPNSNIALKPKYTLATTRIVDIEWSLKNGTLTPVAVVEPVELCGTTVQRASLCNVAMLEDLGIEIGHEVIISKLGEIIPGILRDNTTGKSREGYVF